MTFSSMQMVWTTLINRLIEQIYVFMR